MEISLADIPSGTDYDITIYDELGVKVTGSYLGSNSSELISTTLNASRYYIKVHSYRGYSNDKEYTLKVKTKNAPYNSYTKEQAIENFTESFVWESDYRAPLYWEHSKSGIYPADLNTYALYASNGYGPGVKYSDRKIYFTSNNTSTEVWAVQNGAADLAEELEIVEENGNFGKEISIEFATSLACSSFLRSAHIIISTGVCMTVSGVTNFIMTSPREEWQIEHQINVFKGLERGIRNYTGQNGTSTGPLVINMDFHVEETTKTLSNTKRYYKVFDIYITDLPNTYSEYSGTKFGGTFYDWESFEDNLPEWQ